MSIEGLPDRLERGVPYPLGATWDGLSVNFAVFSAHATQIDLCIFDQTGRRELKRYTLPACTDEVWHGCLPGAQPGLVYGYRAHGPYAPEHGHRFNPHKLLLDPYAKALHGQVKWTDALFGYRVHSSRADLTFDRRDSAPAMTKARVVHDSFPWAEDRRPRTPWNDTVIYEAHVKGISQLLEDVRPPVRGTMAALTHPSVTTHLRRLGITAIELMPVHAFLQDRHLLEKGLSNYWGYNTLSFFAPERRYLSTGEGDEFRVAVRRLHAAGIEVILDVVYNHTCEGSELGPTLSWRGLDNASYYVLSRDNPRHGINDTGTGNTLDLTHPRVLQMVVDSLRYWVTSYGVDGFRFDLGVTLGREAHGFDPGSGFFDVLRQDPVLQTVKLISEPWDVGPGGYQLGRHPPGFAEWNDTFRDGVRRYWRGDAGQRSHVAGLLSGSAHLFNHRTRDPSASINFLASHDGFTLEDVVSYEAKHNEANGENNADGHNENYSRNWGAEGPTDDRQILAQRDRVKRSMLVSLFAALGTPMLVAGDGFGRTQQGNNNAYCQDNEISWVDWKLAGQERGMELTAFIGRLAQLRRRHQLLRPSRFLYGEEVFPGVNDVDWFDERGNTLSDADWHNGEGRALLMRRAVRTENALELIALALNAADHPLTFNLPGDARWILEVDSARPGLQLPDEVGGKYEVEASAAVLFSARREPL